MRRSNDTNHDHQHHDEHLHTAFDVHGREFVELEESGDSGGRVQIHTRVMVAVLKAADRAKAVRLLREEMLPVKTGVLYYAPPPKPVSSLAYLADVAMASEGLRVASQVRLSHFELSDRTDALSTEIHEKLQSVEAFVDAKLIAMAAEEHPTAAWWTSVDRMPKQVMGKILGNIENFGRWYPPTDPLIPHYVTRKPVAMRTFVLTEKGIEFDTPTTEWVWVSGIERLTTPGKLAKLAGLVPGQSRSKGKVLDFNIELKTMLWRLMTFGILMPKNRYYDFYVDWKARKALRLEAQGFRILPTPKERMCLKCASEVVMKAARFCPACGGELSRKTEPDGVMFVGHLDMIARTRTLRLMLNHLWHVWRVAEGLPVREAYVVEYLGHEQVITPEMMAGRGRSFEKS